MTDIWQKLKLEKRPILLYGSGIGAEKIYSALLQNNIKLSGVFASDGFKKERYFKDFKILSYSEAKENFGSFLTLFAFGSKNEEVINFARILAKNGDLLCAEVPVCDRKPFCLEFAGSHRKKLTKVYDLLADEQSKKVFKETLLFKLDGNIERLFSCETDEDEAFENILKLHKGDSFLDLGAYNGDTVLDFVNRVGEYSHITAFEPDIKTFMKLKNNTKHLSVEYINAAVGEKSGQIPFTFKAGRGSVRGGEDFCEVRTIDSLEKSFDYIKFDVEGEELRAIMGGAETIARDKPKMLVSAYHRIEDYFKLPLEVLKIRPDYKVFMRHYRYVPAWDTNFYFV